MDEQLREAIGKALYESSVPLMDDDEPTWYEIRDKEVWIARAVERLKCKCGAPAETICEDGDCAPGTPYCRPCYEKEHLDDWIPGEEPNAHHRATDETCAWCGGPLCSCGLCHNTRRSCCLSALGA